MQYRNLLIVCIALFALVLSACTAPTAPQATEGDSGEEAAAIDGYAKPDTLVDTAWVQEHLEDPNVRLIDLARSQEDYLDGHIPGAVYVNLGDDMTNPEDSTRGQILTQDALSELMSRIGVTPETTVVFYDDASNLLAARAYWAMKYYQHEDVRIYDGGLQQWNAAENELATGEVEVTTTEYAAAAPAEELRTTTEYVLEHIDDPGVVMCDTRNPEEYAGTDVRAARGGRVPGAVNVEWTNAVDSDGTFKDAEALHDLYTNAGFTPDKQVITYCQTGVRGAHTWYVLSELLGFPDVRNYDGSWEEYGNMEETPIES